MIYKIVTCLSIITVSAFENEENTKHAISSQMFHREDIPISYQFHNVHNYKPRHRLEDDFKEHVPKEVRYHTIQYAPLVPGKKGHKESKDNNEQDITPLLPSLDKEHRVHEVSNLEDKPKYDLEPKPLKEDNSVHQQNYRSFVSGHNVEAYPPPVGHHLNREHFLAAQINSQNSKKPHKIVYYQKPTTEALDTTPNHVAIEIQKPVMDFKLHQFAPAEKERWIEVKPPIHNVLLTNVNPLLQNSPQDNKHNLHNELIREKQQQTFQHPRIHLNIGRIYSIANQLQEARLPPILIPKSLQQTNYGKPIPALNLANSIPANILGKPQDLSVAINSLSKQQYTPFNAVPSNNAGKIPAAFYLQKHQENTFMLPVRNIHT